MDREKQIDLMENAEKRAVGYFKRWLDNPEFKAALHRHVQSPEEAPQRHAAG